MRKIATFALLLSLATACGKNAPSSNPPVPAPTNDTVADTVQPDRDALVVHFNDHVAMPADRASILEACAQTPEFTEAEKRWVEVNLPEGSYQSAEAVLAALGLS